MKEFITPNYLLAQLVIISKKSVIAFLSSLGLWLTKLMVVVEPYFFGRDFIIILTVLLMGDMSIGIKKHRRQGDFNWHKMFNKLTFKLMIIAIATVSAKSIVSIDVALNSNVLIIPIKLTIALYLFGNIEKNICQMTEKKLCFGFLIEKIKSLLFIFKK